MLGCTRIGSFNAQGLLRFPNEHGEVLLQSPTACAGGSQDGCITASSRPGGSVGAGVLGGGVVGIVAGGDVGTDGVIEVEKFGLESLKSSLAGGVFGLKISSAKNESFA